MKFLLTFMAHFKTWQGSNATEDCCSKCWAQLRRKNEVTKNNIEERPAVSNEQCDKVNTLQGNAETPDVLTPAAEQRMTEHASSIDGDAVSSVKVVFDEPSPEKKKKKKKTSYKSVMAGMLEGNAATRDLEKEKEKLRDEMGGGHFKKIDRI